LSSKQKVLGLFYIDFFFIIVFFLLILLAVAVSTLLERNFLALGQIRLGPNKVSFLGTLQMILDGIKLFLNEVLIPIRSEDIFYLIMPFFRFILGLFVFLLIYFYNFFYWSWSFIFIFLQVGYSVFSLFILSYLRKSKYRFLGSLRLAAVTLAFDLIFILVSLCLININEVYRLQVLWLTIFFPENYFFLLLTVLPELSRSVFDFTERERELVSGANTELRRVFFILYFLYEYGQIIFYVIFISRSILSLRGLIEVISLGILFYVRAVYPRYRIDKIIALFWLRLLLWKLIFLFIIWLIPI